MSKPAQLEVFDFGAPSILVGADGQSDDWHEGHAVGLQDAQIAANEDAGRLKGELVQTLADMQFGYVEAKAEILSQLGPLFDALIVGFLPRLSVASLVPRLREELTEIVAQTVEEPLQLTVAPLHIVAVSDLLSEMPDLPFTARADPSLGTSQAIVSGMKRDQIIDLDGLLEMAQKTLSAVAEVTEERSEHG